MKELHAIVDAWTALQQRGQPAVLATVVAVQGSAYRRPGARMLLAQDGQRVGMVSGGCLEGDLSRKAWWRTEGSLPIVIEYDTTSDEDVAWGFGLGCRGVIRILLERLDPLRGNTPLDFIRRCLTERRSAALARVIAGNDEASVGGYFALSEEGETDLDLADAAMAASLRACAVEALRRGESAHFTVGAAKAVEVFVEMIRPPLPLFLCGTGADALPLVRLAKELGWYVTVLDSRRRDATRQRLSLADEVLLMEPEAAAQNVALSGAAVVMTHNFLEDRQWLPVLLASPVRYIGLLGPRQRADRLLSDLAGAGFTLDERIHSPVGLDLGGETAEEIALAILAEIQAVFAGRLGGSLSGQKGPLHERGRDSYRSSLPESRRIRPVCLAGRDE